MNARAAPAIKRMLWMFSAECHQEALGQMVEREARRNPELFRRA